MANIQTDVLVIGGGATGTGVGRDLAMRGFSVILVERGDLTHGTTGRYHGLLHSGGRYVVKDPQAAQECIEENRILRRIMPQCIEDTGGFFVLTPWDDPQYASRFLTGCQQAGIPSEEIPISQMLREEPLLNPTIERCFRVPDASADSFLASDLNAVSARQYGARILTYHKVTDLLFDGSRVSGARCHDLVKDEQITILADLVVNASGAWANQIASMAGIQVQIIPGKGTMIAMNHRIVNTVINRCKMPSDGDILVPAHTVVVIGTTDVKVDDPDRFAIEPWEVHLMLEEGDKLVPGFKDMRMLRAWAGVRPLYKETNIEDTPGSDSRDVTRAYTLLDHDRRDGVVGLITITSGKWTTYRKMAEATVDLVCEKFGTFRACRTHQEPLPESGAHTGHYLGARLAEVEKLRAFGQLICECELATYDEVRQAIVEGQAKTIDDIRRDVRLGMGPCQGGFCTYRVAGILHELRHPAVEETNLALRDFLQERWKGLLPILWGGQLKQERLDELIYLSILNAEHLPGPRASRLSPTLYDSPSSPLNKQEDTGYRMPPSSSHKEKPEVGVPPSPYQGEGLGVRVKYPDLLVLGAGLSGLAAAWQATATGLSTRLLAKGWGALYWHAGCIDVLGYYPIEDQNPIVSPAASLVDLIHNEPEHPYALAGLDGIQQAITDFQALCTTSGYPMHGSLENNWWLPSALGAFRPTCLAPETMIAGDLRQPGAMLLVGFQGFRDFYPDLIADNLNAQGVPARGETLELSELDKRSFVTSRTLGNLFDRPEFREQVIAALKSKLAHLTNFKPARIGFPAVLGLDEPLQVKRYLEDQLNLPVFEIPTLPPSIPGIRLSRILVAAIEQLGGRIFDGMQAIAASINPEGRSVTAIWSEAASRTKPHAAKNFLLATGGILGGGLEAVYEGDNLGKLRETVWNLPIKVTTNRNEWLFREFLFSTAHPIYRAGIRVNSNFQPIGSNGQIVYDNLYAVGTTLDSNDYIRQRSFDGVALVTGYLAPHRLAAQESTSSS